MPGFVTTILCAALLWLACLLPAAAQHALVNGVDFAAVDRYALAAPADAARTTASLAAYLSQGPAARNELLTARAIYRWMAENLTYDVAMFDRIRGPGGVRNQTADELLKSRKGVCGCYVNLFVDLARRAGLQAVEVDGYSRGFGFTPGQSVTGNTHAWVSMRINGQWCLLDPTWGSGYIDDQNQFVRACNDYYFLVPPEQLILSHFPLDPKFQMLPTPVTLKTFEEFVHLKPAFFRLGLRLETPVKGAVTVGADFKATLRATAQTQLAASLWQENRELGAQYAFIQNVAGGRIDSSVVFPAPGNYNVRIFAKKRGQEGKYGLVLEYGVIATAGRAGDVGFPETYEMFNVRMCQLYSPMSRFLKTGSRQVFKLSVPGATKVMVIAREERHETPLQTTNLKRGATFEGEVRIPMPCEVVVFAEFPGDKSYAGLLRYVAN
jgi:hypothetical protein